MRETNFDQTTLRVSVEQLQAIIDLQKKTFPAQDVDNMIEIAPAGGYGVAFRFRVGEPGLDMWQAYKTAIVEPGGSVHSVDTLSRVRFRCRGSLLWNRF